MAQRDRSGYFRQYYQDNPTYYKEYIRRRQQESREFIQQQKAGSSCKRCGIDDWRVLDFHHLDRSMKEADTSEMVKAGWSKERILREIEKCEVLCANCHRILHWEEKYGG